MSHRCHAIGCDRDIPPCLWGCSKHWYLVPRDIRKQIWQHYVPGQEIRKNPTQEYVYWALQAKVAVAKIEGLTDHPEYQQAVQAITDYEAAVTKAKEENSDPG